MGIVAVPVSFATGTERTLQSDTQTRIRASVVESVYALEKQRLLSARLARRTGLTRYPGGVGLLWGSFRPRSIHSMRGLVFRCTRGSLVGALAM